MQCRLCGKWEVGWVGPYGALTGTKCKACGGENCQVVHCQDCERTDEHVHCPECGSTEHRASECESY